MFGRYSKLWLFFVAVAWVAMVVLAFTPTPMYCYLTAWCLYLFGLLAFLVWGARHNSKW